MKDKIEQQKKHFNAIAKKYFDARKDPNHLYYKELLWDNFFKNNTYLLDQKNVLEPMCGYAEGFEILQKHLVNKIDYEGFDYSEEIINLLSKKNLKVYVMDITKFIPKKKYDIVIIIGGLHHVPQYVEHVLATINDSLKVGGYFINFEPTHNSFITKYIRDKIYKGNSLFDYETEEDFNLNELNNLYKNNNFDIVYQKYPGLFSYILYYNPDAFPFLNLGNKSLVKFFYTVDKILSKVYIDKKFSFTTLSVLQKNS